MANGRFVVSQHIHTCIHTNIRTHTNTHTQTHAHTHTHTHVRTHAYTHTYTMVCVPKQRTQLKGTSKHVLFRRRKFLVSVPVACNRGRGGHNNRGREGRDADKDRGALLAAVRLHLHVLYLAGARRICICWVELGGKWPKFCRRTLV